SQQALEFLLLYDWLYIPARILRVSLTQEAKRFVRVIRDDTTYWKDSAWFEWLIECLREVTKEPVTAPRDKHYESIPLNSAVLRAFKKSDIDRLLVIQGMLLPYLRTRPSTFQTRVTKLHFETVIGLLTGDSFSYRVWQAIGRNEKRDNLAWGVKLAASRMFEELKMLDWLLSKSAKLGIPVATPRVRAIKNKTISMNTSADYERAFQIYLQEVATFPLLRSIRDVEALRSRKEIKRFRSSLQEWTSAIRAGEPDAEQRLRKEIQAANETLRYLGRLRKVGWWTTALSLPLGIAELLLGSLGFGGLTLAALGSATLLKTKKARTAGQWLILGN